MNKKLVAVAIAGLLAAPLAQAQTANVTLYGRLNLDLEFVKGQQANGSNPTQYRVSSNSSRFGLRGTESLGGGLNAIFQVENSLTADNSGGSLAGRDTFVGLQGGWGTMKVGFYHLPYDNIHGYIWGSNPTLETGIMATSSIWAQGFASKAAGGFDSRIGNSVRWDSPIWSGWQTQWSYSIGGGAAGQEGTFKSTSSVSSGAVFYMNGPIYFGAAFQYNNSVRQLGLNDLAYSFAGAYQFPKVRVGAVYERLDYDCANVATVSPPTSASIAAGLASCQTAKGPLGTSSLTRNMYGVDLTIDAGPGQFYFDWSFGGNGGGSVVNGARVAGLAKGDNSSSNQWEVSYTYPLSKRT
ncbi:MAG: porin, partial [Betaproteobacteria bacterium]